MRLLPALAVLTVSAGPALFAADGPPREVRGLWVVRTALVSPAEVDRVVDEATEAGFNTLFVQVRGRGDAFYQSRIVSRSLLLSQQPASFDPFARLLDRARARGLDVHAWINVLLTAHFGQPLPEGHILRQHPEWVMLPRSSASTALRASPATLFRLGNQAKGDPDVEGQYLSPSAPGVREHLEAVVKEIVRTYPVDGLHLDFIRYPNADYDYSPAALEGFRRLRGEGDLLGGPSRNPEAWDEYRRSSVTVLASRLSAVARSERPGIVVSAAVAPDEAQAVAQRFQAWPRWLSDRLLDAVVPMAYTPDSRLFSAQVQQAKALVLAGQGLWAGIGAYRLDLAGIVEKIQLARESGAAGVVLFSHESLAPADLRRLREAAFTPAVAGAATRTAGGGAGSR
jgi:uncharacterized lipoprotein YddW (UPF0748 family)